MIIGYMGVSNVMCVDKLFSDGSVLVAICCGDVCRGVGLRLNRSRLSRHSCMSLCVRRKIEGCCCTVGCR